MEYERHQGHEGHEDSRVNAERVAKAVIDAGLKVHRTLGPGLLESVYERCLAQELELRNLPVRRQQPLPVIHEGVRLEAGYRLDMVVADSVVIEIKAVEQLNRLHDAQLLTDLRLSNIVSACL